MHFLFLIEADYRLILLTPAISEYLQDKLLLFFLPLQFIHFQILTIQGVKPTFCRESISNLFEQSGYG
jgi:hypothetical protein